MNKSSSPSQDPRSSRRKTHKSQDHSDEPTAKNSGISQKIVSSRRKTSGNSNKQDNKNQEKSSAKNTPSITIPKVKKNYEIYVYDDSIFYESETSESDDHSDEYKEKSSSKIRSPNKMYKTRRSPKRNQTETSIEQAKEIPPDGSIRYFHGNQLVETAIERPIVVASTPTSPKKANDKFLEAFINPNISPQRSMSNSPVKSTQNSPKKTSDSALQLRNILDLPPKDSDDEKIKEMADESDEFIPGSISDEDFLQEKNKSQENTIITSPTRAILRKGAMKPHTGDAWDNEKFEKSKIEKKLESPIGSQSSTSPSALITRTDAYGNAATEAIFADTINSKIDTPDTSADFDARMRLMRAAFTAGSSKSNSANRSPTLSRPKMSPQILKKTEPKPIKSEIEDNTKDIIPEIENFDTQKDTKELENTRTTEKIEKATEENISYESDSIPMPEADPEIQRDSDEIEANDIQQIFDENKHEEIEDQRKSDEEQHKQRVLRVDPKKPRKAANRKTSPRARSPKSGKVQKEESPQESPIPEKATKLEIPETPISPFEQIIEKDVESIVLPKSSAGASPTFIRNSGAFLPSPDVLKQITAPLQVSVEEEEQEVNVEPPMDIPNSSTFTSISSHKSLEIQDDIGIPTPDEDLIEEEAQAKADTLSPKKRKQVQEKEDEEDQIEQIIPIALRKESRSPVRPKYFNEDEFAFGDDIVIHKEEKRRGKPKPFQYMEMFPRRGTTDSDGNVIFPGISLDHSHIDRVVVPSGNSIVTSPARVRLLIHVLEGTGLIRRDTRIYKLSPGSEAAVVKNDDVEITNNQKGKNLVILFIHL